ncbi:RNA polymerase sigma factor [Paenibacillus sp. PL91]|uniref:RNA polymerase sigma factor n=1 Tax=Paenibacillus sp. PL91 TaxID=2729538 RepID=UPI00145D865B|nr:sigma-70 family RNA polymerase sigma factor [Paenibacillus sp. PL91]MBC9201970.1 sigma-70 family RNA polymerase sigma factor [Paenibacillus sp. PL91]
MEVWALGSASLTSSEAEAGGQEQALVERARSGDEEAFGELVRRHRAKALGLAGALTKDSFMAEDIVQEALIRAFLHLGTLTDASRFMPWLHRIVRNQAYMKLRRGGPYSKEKPFIGFMSESGMTKDAGKSGQAIDWGDIDSILFHLTDHALYESNGQSPEQHVMRQEMLQSIHRLIRCLNKRERDIFEARFFGELPPAEIAVLFDTTTANVYNTLSRSRAKLQKERLRMSISLYVEQRATLGLHRRRILAPPPL